MRYYYAWLRVIPNFLLLLHFLHLVSLHILVSVTVSSLFTSQLPLVGPRHLSPRPEQPAISRLKPLPYFPHHPPEGSWPGFWVPGALFPNPSPHTQHAPGLMNCLSHWPCPFTPLFLHTSCPFVSASGKPLPTPRPSPQRSSPDSDYLCCFHLKWLTWFFAF